MSDSLRIDTTQNVRLSFQIASLGDRIAAGIIDLIIMLGYLFIMFLIMIDGFGTYSTTLYVVILLPVIFYHLLFEVFNNGRSIGKIVLKTRVVRIDGSEPRMGDFVIRWLLGMLELSIGMGSIAVIAILFGGKGQRFGDMLAGTTVAKIKQNVTLEETLFEELEEDYEMKYPMVEKLDDRDIETIKAVLATYKKDVTDLENRRLLEKTRKAIIQKMDAEVEFVNNKSFLEQVVKDFNYLTGKIND